MKKRLRVIHRVETDLSPIEVALDEMRQRVAELEEVIFTKPTDVKKLQLKLQVCGFEKEKKTLAELIFHYLSTNNAIFRGNI